MVINEKQQPNNAIVGCAYVFPSEIDSELVIGTTEVSLSLISGKMWQPVYFTPGSALLTTQESTSFAGRLLESKFEMKIPGGTVGQHRELARICGRPIVLKFCLLYTSPSPRDQA
eukprot:TRINITY_DN35057_c0_g1_i2.p3 TRINITY_DN35057_c0_g1~~TRINITY_DN35057_c0_g1_i2.p3  ORF type:complete len:115 (-),score=13.10 TRINITY_DN35057_c0_g1_i2:76-420(-)